MSQSSSPSRLVASVIADVRKNGDAALIRLAAKIDKVKLSTRTLRVPSSRFRAAFDALDSDMRRALEACGRRIQDFHYQEKKHIPDSWTYVKDGVRLGQIYSPIESVGVYVPGGRFSYPSTLLMTAIPARLAGVRRIAVVTPPARLSNEILAAAHVAGVQELYQVGGPAAVAALALGTKTIPKVDLIIGPGNALVTEAKRQLFGEVGIDLLAGPSELAVLADDSANAEAVAADMAAQAEHDPDARSYLISLSRKLIGEVKRWIPHELRDRCELIYEGDRAKAIAKANALAAEHVEILVRRPQDCLDTIKNGGAIFLNEWSPAVMGDYWAGPSHVLPTGRSARFASGLSVMTFLKRSSLVEISGGAYRKGWGAAHKMAESEGLTQHARALRSRVTDEGRTNG
jgi:histidinol dehydrogenase